MLSQVRRPMRFLIVISLFFVASCGKNVQQAIEESREFSIVTRVGASTYTVNANNGASGFDYDLVRRLADELGLKSRIVLAASGADIVHVLKNGEAHLAAAWQTPVDDDLQLRSSAPYFPSHNVLVTHEASLALTSINQLRG